MKRSTMIIAAAAAVGLLVLIGLAQQVSTPESAADSGKKSGSARGGSSREPERKSSWFSWSDSDDKTQPAKKRSESDRRAIQASEKGHGKRRHAGAAGSAAAEADARRYSSDPQGIGMAIMGVQPALRECYEGYGRLTKTAPEDVHVRVTIGPDPKDPDRGIVTKASTAEKERRHPEVEGCLKNAVSSLRFDRVNKPIEANLPLVFARRK